MSFSAITELAPGKVFALHNTFELDGQVSAYPHSARGYSTSNCYLLKEDDGAILLDTGYAAHAEAILGQLRSLIDPEMPLSVFPLRLNEFMSVCNVMDVARNFNVVECYSNVPEIESWIEFETVDRDNPDHPNVATTLLERGDFAQVSIGKNHVIDVLNAPIRLISTRWIYDPESKILFSSDMFSHVWHAFEEGPWVLDGLDNVTDEAFVRSFLLNTRYWWIEGATIDSARRNVHKVFETYDIETLAPGYGTILRGREQVERQFTVLDNVLRDLDRSNTKPRYVPRGMER
ncbi:MAG: hypothetical protein VW644_08185 [Alphaproteobacteria bacterium]|jgi:hypothetical protein